VLVDSRAVVEDIWRRWATERGYDPAPYLRVAHGRRIGETLASVDPTLDIEREVRLLDAAEAADITPMTPIAGARELVGRLASDRWAIVTSGGYGLASRRLDRAGIPRPTVFITADDVQRGKPDPQGYLLAAQRLGRDPAVSSSRMRRPVLRRRARQALASSRSPRHTQQRRCAMPRPRSPISAHCEWIARTQGWS
jgi:sugar-phosphatase